MSLSQSSIWHRPKPPVTIVGGAPLTEQRRVQRFVARVLFRSFQYEDMVSTRLVVLRAADAVLGVGVLAVATPLGEASDAATCDRQGCEV